MGTSGMMELGQKFEAMKGPALLHGALRQAIPDLEYGPGKPHQDLVRLPWADILTTNWDTLLEQAIDAYDRSYELVVQPKQLAVATAPRIVKLHGCIRSGSKLIFTEEDFRRYPSEYAPFVSLVQQSLMENVFVLIGFSGTDPNFKAWHGWVRDSLGRYLQPIYLVTNKPADPTDISLYAGRFVTVVDLSQLEVGDDYKSMLDEFFKRLRDCRREFRENLDWPLSQRSSNESSTAPTLARWRSKLDERPKWLVLPASNRQELARSLDDAIDAAAREAKAKEGEENPAKSKTPFRDAALTAVFEDPQTRDREGEFHLSDRETAATVIAEALSLSLARPKPALVDLLRRIFAEIILAILPQEDSPESEPNEIQDPYARLMSLVTDTYLDELQSGFQPTRFNELGMDLLPLFIVLEREARWRGERDQAAKIMRILGLFDLGGEAVDLQSWARLQDNLDRLDADGAAKVLAEWTPRTNEAVSMLRHAAGLRELGRITQCEAETLQAIEIVRRLATAPEQHLADASREAWAFAIYADLLTRNSETLSPVVHARRRGVKLDGVIEELADRLDELEVRRCDPRRELNRLAREFEREELRLALRAANVPKPEGTEKEFNWIFADPAPAFLVLSETIGLSLWNVELGNALGLIAARLLAPDWPRLALTLLLRAGRPSDVPVDGATFRTFFLMPDEEKRISNIKAVVANLLRLNSWAVPSTNGANGQGEVGYVAGRIAYLIYLLRGIVACGTELGPELFDRICNAACATHDSAIVEMTDTGWVELSGLFQAMIRTLIEQQTKTRTAHNLDSFRFIERLLWIAEPRPSSIEGVVGARSNPDWPDPFEIIAWRHKDQPVSAPGRPVFVLRPMGEHLVMSAQAALRRLPDAKERIGHLHQLRKHLNASIGTTGTRRDVALSRRLVVIDALLERGGDVLESGGQRIKTGARSKRSPRRRQA